MAACHAGKFAEHRPIGIGTVMSTEVPGGGRPEPGADEPSLDGLVLRMLLGSQLRRLREAADITPERAGYET